jgi:hypothetical protein
MLWGALPCGKAWRMSVWHGGCCVIHAEPSSNPGTNSTRSVFEEESAMQRVIASYDNLPQAYRAVRQLEQQHSIQDLVMVDARRPGWRKLRYHPTASSSTDEPYLVVMIGGADEIARASSLIARND